MTCIRVILRWLKSAIILIVEDLKAEFRSEDDIKK